MRLIFFVLTLSMIASSCQTRQKRETARTSNVTQADCGTRMNSNFTGPNADPARNVQERHDYCRQLVDTYGEPPLIRW